MTKNISYDGRHIEIAHHLRIMTSGAELRGHSLLLIAAQRLMLAAYELTAYKSDAQIFASSIDRVENVERILSTAKAAISSREKNFEDQTNETV